MRTILTAIVLALLTVSPIRADVIDPDSPSIDMLNELAGALDRSGVDVLFDHGSDIGRVGPSYGDRPRVAPLLGFAAWPNVSVDLDRHAEWLDAFESGARGAIAAVPSDEPARHDSPEAFREIWDNATGGERVVLTFDAADLAVAEQVASVLERAGHAVYLAIAEPERETLDPESLGRLFIEADLVLCVDTANARLNPVIQFEAELLAELKRQREWLARADGLPPIKRGPMDVIESLDALSLRILPGGIVLGVRAECADDLEDTQPIFSGSFYGVEIGGDRLAIAEVSDETRESIAAFVRIPDSHSVVDIAGGEVTLASAFESTRIGRRMEKADRMPFQHLSIDGAQKSLIVDNGVVIRRHGDRLAADVVLEARFYRRDDDGHAVRLATLEFTVEDATQDARLQALTWTRRPGTRIRFDGDGVGGLVDSLEALALDAALIALARRGEAGTVADATAGP